MKRPLSRLRYLLGLGAVVGLLAAELAVPAVQQVASSLPSLQAMVQLLPDGSDEVWAARPPEQRTERRPRTIRSVRCCSPTN